MKNAKFSIMKLRWILLLTGMIIYLMPVGAYSQDTLTSGSSVTTTTTRTIKMKDAPKKKLDWNEFDLGFTTFRLGVAGIMDYAAYIQDATAKAQMDSANIEIKNQWKARDFRFFFAGNFNTKRQITWKVGIMYDGTLDAWQFRETGLLIGLPEIKGQVFIGRSKEGYSLNKDQNGYSCWGNERQMSLDLISIMADGIRFYGYFPKPRISYSLGAYSNFLYGHDSKFDLWEWQFSGRFGYRPIYDEKKNKLIHLGFNVRYAQPDQKKITVKSRPESNPAPYFLNTGQFESDACAAVGWESYYRSGPLLLGTEGNLYSFSSDPAGDPKYFGFNVIASYLFPGGNSWPFLSNKSAFHFVKPNKSIFDGGFGAVEFLLQASSYNLNSGSILGGSFWKITPMINWYPSYNFRFELVYGYGMLNRFQLNGATQFFQARIQVQIL
jgi:phosphate-selective porin OprO/OprP